MISTKDTPILDLQQTLQALHVDGLLQVSMQKSCFNVQLFQHQILLV